MTNLRCVDNWRMAAGEMLRHTEFCDSIPIRSRPTAGYVPRFGLKLGRLLGIVERDGVIVFNPKGFRHNNVTIRDGPFALPKLCSNDISPKK